MKANVIVAMLCGRERVCRAMTAITPENGRAVRDNRGFTLLELLLVLIILAILTLISYPTLIDLRYRAKVTRAKAEIRSLEKEITSYFADRGVFPAQLSDLGQSSLRDLRDPWGNGYVYYKIASDSDDNAYKDIATNQLNTDFDLYSKGANGLSLHSLIESVCADDIVRANEGQHVELGIEF